VNTNSEGSLNRLNFSSELEARVAEKYKKQGFSVIVNPDFSRLPFDLGGYRPDLIAQKEPDQNYIIEIKGSSRQISVDHFRSIAETVHAHPEWRFLIITGDDDLPVGSEFDLLRYDEALQRADQAEALIVAGAAEASFLFLWSTLEGMMRRRSSQSDIPIERMTPLAMTNHFYSQGELSREQFHQIKEFVSIRNRAVHGFRDPQIGEGAKKLLLLVRELASEWQQD
jgi:hypothetical protein